MYNNLTTNISKSSSPNYISSAPIDEWKGLISAFHFHAAIFIF